MWRDTAVVGRDLAPLLTPAGVAAAVRAGLQGIPAHRRTQRAAKLAQHLRARQAHVRAYGCGPNPNGLPLALVAALCWGAGLEREERMLALYEAAAQTAERFVAAAKGARTRRRAVL